MLVIVLFAQSGCGIHVHPALPNASSEVQVGAVCARTINSYLVEGGQQLDESVPSLGPRLVPLVEQVALPNGELATEVDCYVDIRPSGSWLVYAHVAIPPPSQRAVEHLRNAALAQTNYPSAASRWASDSVERQMDSKGHRTKVQLSKRPS
ncbi:MAG: hypothetical protein C5B58_11210 [Acidobacteria bacterium]|nr:MAG: hypothetical protein C5B58_11210 [Acidobacteriota bacterium]